VVTSLRSEVAIVVMVNLVQWMLYQIGNIRQIQLDSIRIAGSREADIRLLRSESNQSQAELPIHLNCFLGLWRQNCGVSTGESS